MPEDRVEKSSVAFLLLYCLSVFGGLAQLARALAWHARGHRFDPDILHNSQQNMLHMIFDILDNTRFFESNLERIRANKSNKGKTVEI